MSDSDIIGTIAQVRSNRSFFVAERDRAYEDWTASLHRELIQNAVDGGAKNIDISITSEFGRGVLGREAECPIVTRVAYQDDGVGMTPEVLEDVYFSLHGSTKNSGESVGGFGRARLMTTFSQPRYSIRTGDRWAQGVGAEYVLRSRDQALREIDHWRDQARDRKAAAISAGDTEAECLHQREIDLLEQEYETLAHGPRKAKGCRVELDLNPQDAKSPERRPTVERMKETLHAYLSRSAIKAKVTLNGELIEAKKVAVKPAAKILARVDNHRINDGWRENPKIEILPAGDGASDIAFGEMKLVDPKSDHGLPAGKILVRSSGALMFETSSGNTEHTLILELNPSLAREVMTSNRDALRDEYKTALEEFSQRMATDTDAALRGKPKTEFTVLQGGKGLLSSRPEKVEIDLAAPTAVTGFRTSRSKRLAERVEASQSIWFSDWQFDGFVKDGLENVPAAEFHKLFEGLKGRGTVDGTILERFPGRQQSEAFLTALDRYGPRKAMEVASGPLLGHLVNSIKLHQALADEAESALNRDKLSDLHDVPIYKENLQPDAKLDPALAKKLTRAFHAQGRRLDPRNWDLPNGEGLQARKLLAVWQVAVQQCLAIAAERLPKTPSFPYSVGWVLALPRHQWQSLSGDYGYSIPEAVFHRPDAREDLRYFLLNPLDQECQLRYSAGNAEDRHAIIVLAAHECAHTYAPQDHNSAFAQALTELTIGLTPKRLREIHKEMDASIQLIDRLYGRGRTRVVALDKGNGSRPAERLLDSLSDDARREAVEVRADGVCEVDCERIDELESTFGAWLDQEGARPSMA